MDWRTRRQVAATPETIYDIASVSTLGCDWRHAPRPEAVLNIDDSIGKHLDDLRHRGAHTIRHLLTHVGLVRDARDMSNTATEGFRVIKTAYSPAAVRARGTSGISNADFRRWRGYYEVTGRP